MNNMTKKILVALALAATLFILFRPAFAVIGDVNGDGKVDMQDIGIVARAFGTSPGAPRWNPAADVNGDGTVDMRDIALVASHFGQ